MVARGNVHLLARLGDLSVPLLAFLVPAHAPEDARWCPALRRGRRGHRVSRGRGGSGLLPVHVAARRSSSDLRHSSCLHCSSGDIRRQCGSVAACRLPGPASAISKGVPNVLGQRPLNLNYVVGVTGGFLPPRVRESLSVRQSERQQSQGAPLRPIVQCPRRIGGWRHTGGTRWRRWFTVEYQN